MELCGSLYGGLPLSNEASRFNMLVIQGAFVEKVDKELIESSLQDNFELRKLYQEHARLEEKLKTLGHKNFLTDQERREELELKQQKLRGVEKMLALARGT
jgi:heme oxygenase